MLDIIKTKCTKHNVISYIVLRTLNIVHSLLMNYFIGAGVATLFKFAVISILTALFSIFI